MEKQIYKKAEFARLAGVSRAAVSQAVKAGFLISDDGMIDITHPKNAGYISTNRHKRPRLTKPEPAKDPESIISECEEEKVVESLPEQIPKLKRVSKNRYSRGYDPSNDDESLTKEAADIKKIKIQTANLRLKYEKDLKTLVLRTDVDRVFQGIYSVAINYFLVLGDRLSPILASLCNVIDPKIVIEMKNRIDAEVTRGLEELKRQTEDVL